jgi:hypothetical protein
MESEMARAMESEGEVPVTAAVQPVQIIVKGQWGEVAFKMKRDAPLQKVFDAFADRKGLQRGTVRFTFNGEFIQGTHTPKMLEMKENDEIEAHVEQEGGDFF